MSDMTGMTASEDLPIWTLGDRLRKSRDQAGIKQEEMAQRLAKSRAHGCLTRRQSICIVSVSPSQEGLFVCRP